jgi:DNA-3-methyladenine glycosylase
MTGGSYKLRHEFYLRQTLEVAHDLLGKFLVYKSGGNLLSARLVETEAYIGKGDPACHASVGKTKRNEVMFGPGGFSYIYFIYGMYYCLNVVTEDEGFPAAVLIRAAEPVEGVELMKKRYANPGKNKLTNGPGKLCKAFNLTREDNGLDLTGDKLYLEDRGYKVSTIKRSQRIGIKKGVDKLWRFYDSDSAFVSKR